MLRKLLFMALVCLLSAGTAFAQSGTITGTVTDRSSGETLPSVNVYIVELQRGAASNARGQFTIENVDYGTYTVRASFVGYNAYEQQVTVDESTVTLDITLGSSMQQLEDVVVTAYGIEQSLNDLPYSAQKVDGEIVSENRSDNFISALNGRVSGLKISQSNGMGGSTNIVMRGYKSISGDNQVLFVVDGVPYANQEFNSDRVKRGASGFDYGNTGVDVNPDNIASVNVLKGPAAAALYGSRASNGAIVIQTKTGQPGNRPVEVTFNSSATIQKVNPNTFIDMQMEYGAGYSGVAAGFVGSNADVNNDGTVDLVGNIRDDASMGPQFEGQPVYQWNAFVDGGPNYHQTTPWVAPENTPIDFFDTGTDFTNSIQIDGGFEGGYYSMGYNKSNNTGVVPNAKMNRNKLNFAAGYDVSDKFSVSGKIQYSRTDGRARPGRGYGQTMTMFRQWWATNVDIEDQRRAYFRNRTNASWNWSSTAATGPLYWDNPYWTRYENYSTDERDRYFGNVEASYEIVDWLNVTGRISLDSYSMLIEERINKTSLAVSRYLMRRQDFSEFNYDVLANYQKQLNESVRISGIVGMNLRRNHKQAINARTNGGLVVPGLYSLNNSVSSIQYPNETDEKLGVNGYFASLNISYNDFLNIEATGRRDKSSSLPEGNNVYYYPSVSAGFTFSEFVDVDWLSFGKIRGSWAEVGNTAPVHSLQNTYDRPSNIGSVPLYRQPSTENNPNLKPERTKSWEVGLQMGVLNDRVTFDVNYYDQNTINQILATDVSTSTGYASQYVNAGNVENRGIEVSLTGRPIVSRDFTWTVNVNWNKNINKVKALAPGIDNYQLESMQGGVTVSAALGQPYGAIRGTDFANLDGESWSENGGKRLVNSNGYYVLANNGSNNNIIGDMNPDWTGGISNRLNYQNWSLNVLVDVRWGGDIFNLDRWYGEGTGLTKNTIGLNSKGNPKRDPVASGGGIILDGYNADGSENEIFAPAGTYFDSWGSWRSPNARYIYDGSYVKLREVGLTYNLPQNIIDKVGPIRGASVSAIGRNLWIIHKNLPGADPEQGIAAGNVQGYQVGAFPTTRNVTLNLKLEF